MEIDFNIDLNNIKLTLLPNKYENIKIDNTLYKEIFIELKKQHHNFPFHIFMLNYVLKTDKGRVLYYIFKFYNHLLEECKNDLIETSNKILDNINEYFNLKKVPAETLYYYFFEKFIKNVEKYYGDSSKTEKIEKIVDNIIRVVIAAKNDKNIISIENCIKFLVDFINLIREECRDNFIIINIL